MLLVLSSEPNILQGCSLLALRVLVHLRGMAELHRRGLDRFIAEWVCQSRPLLGICLGMQMLFESSDEFGLTDGLGFLRGKVRKLPTEVIDGQSLILPHMGWNRLLSGPAWPQKHLKLLSDQYFVHTYVATEVDPDSVLCFCKYGHEPFIAAVQEGAVMGVQFHPERSGPDGLMLLEQLCVNLLDLN